MANEIRTVVLDVKTGNIEVRNIEDKLQTYYDIIGCDLIEIVDRRIGGRVYSIVCDEEGCFVEDPEPSVLDNDLTPMIVGNVVITARDGPELASLTDEDIDNLARYVIHGRTDTFPEPHPLIRGAEYP